MSAPTAITATSVVTGIPGAFAISNAWSATGALSFSLVLNSIIWGVLRPVWTSNVNGSSGAYIYTNTVTGGTYKLIATAFSGLNQQGASDFKESDEATVYNPFGGPQGVQGYQGGQGLQGVRGPDGAQGQRGIQGLMEINGYAGANQLVTTASDKVHLNTNPAFTITGTNLNIGGNITTTATTSNQIGGVTLSNCNLSTTQTITSTNMSALFASTNGVAVDSAGNIYVVDGGNHTIRKITSGGIVSTIAGLAGSTGSTDGTGSLARFNTPYGAAVDSAGNIYVSDSGNHTIRMIASGGIVSTIAGLAGSSGSADGTGSAARFNSPYGVAVDSAGNIYVADGGNHTIRRIASGGIVSTIAGLAGSTGSTDAAGSLARFNSPYSVAVDSAGNIYVADTFNNTIRRITVGVVSTFAGLAGSTGSTDGVGSLARFNSPYGVAVNSAGTTVYVADGFNFAIRAITSGGSVSTIAGLAGSLGSADGVGSLARFSITSKVVVDSAGIIYVTDNFNRTVRKITSGGLVSTIAGIVGKTGSNDGMAIGTAAVLGVTSFTSGIISNSSGNLSIVGSTGYSVSIQNFNSNAIYTDNASITVNSNGSIILRTSANTSTTFAGPNSPWTYSNSASGANVFSISSNGNLSNSNATSNTIGGVTITNGTIGNSTGNLWIVGSSGSTVAIQNNAGNAAIQMNNNGSILLQAASNTNTTFASSNSPWIYFNSATAVNVFNIASNGNISNSNATSNTIGGTTLSNAIVTVGGAVAGSTAANSVNVAGGYYVNGVILQGGSAISTYSNAGAIVFATGTSTGLQGSSNLFFSNNLNLGIQTTTPATALDVNGGVTIRNGYRPLYSNVASSSLTLTNKYTVPANVYGTHYNITTTALTIIALPGVVASDTNAYWVFRNNTGTYLSITFTYTTVGVTAPTNPVMIPPENSVTMMIPYVGGSLNYVLF